MVEEGKQLSELQDMWIETSEMEKQKGKHKKKKKETEYPRTVRWLQKI